MLGFFLSKMGHVSIQKKKRYPSAKRRSRRQMQLGRIRREQALLQENEMFMPVPSNTNDPDPLETQGEIIPPFAHIKVDSLEGVKCEPPEEQLDPLASDPVMKIESIDQEQLNITEPTSILS